MEDEELPAQRYERDLVQKLKVLRHELSLQQPQAGHCRIEVSREEIFEVRDIVQHTGRDHVRVQQRGGLAQGLAPEGPWFLSCSKGPLCKQFLHFSESSVLFAVSGVGLTAL